MVVVSINLGTNKSPIKEKPFFNNYGVIISFEISIPNESGSNLGSMIGISPLVGLVLFPTSTSISIVPYLGEFLELL